MIPSNRLNMRAGQSGSPRCVTTFSNSEWVPASFQADRFRHPLDGPNAAAVLTAIGGCTNTNAQVPNGSSECSTSPRPVAEAVPPCKQKGTSEPIVAPISESVLSPSPSPHSSFNAINVAAASADPPASPAAIGICFSR